MAGEVVVTHEEKINGGFAGEGAEGALTSVPITTTIIDSLGTASVEVRLSQDDAVEGQANDATVRGTAAGEILLPGPLSWLSDRSCVLVNDQPFRIKGLNWFGFETEDNCLHGSWGGQRPMSFYLDFVAEHGFNALRIPFSVKLALSLDTTFPKADFIQADNSLTGLSCGAILDKLVEEAGKRHIMIMLDQHRIDPARGIGDLWYDVDYDESTILKSWDLILSRYKKYWNVFALDLKNENHGPCAWGNGEQFTDWKAAAERIIAQIAKTHPDFTGLFFVGGIWGERGHWWGGNFRNVRKHPIDLKDEGLNRRVVYTPHVYGPDVYRQPYFSSWSFPNNLPAVWDAHWGFIRETTSRAVVVGEWGGFCRGKDAKWQKQIARYLKEKGMADNFYWCLNPNSGDTGGVLADDWFTPQYDKLAILHDLQPAPSKLRPLADGDFSYQLGVETKIDMPHAAEAEPVKCFGGGR